MICLLSWMLCEYGAYAYGMETFLVVGMVYDGFLWDHVFILQEVIFGK